MAAPEKLSTKEAIAELLGVKPRTVWVWSWVQKKFPGVKVGRRRQYRWSDVEKAMLKKEDK